MPSVLGGDALSQSTINDIFAARTAAQDAATAAEGHAGTASDAQTAITALLGQIETLATQIEGHANTIATAVGNAISVHNQDGAAHGATSLPNASTFVRRDGVGRARFANPANAQDAATKGYVDNLVHGGGIAYELGVAGPFLVTEEHVGATLIVAWQESMEIRLPNPAGLIDGTATAGFFIRVVASPGTGNIVLTCPSASIVALDKPLASTPAVVTDEVGLYRPGLVTIVPFRRPSGGEAGPWEWFVAGDTFEV